MSDLTLSGLLMIIFSRAHAVGFHYETYGEISPSRPLPYALHLSTTQLYFAVSDISGHCPVIFHVAH